MQNRASVERLRGFLMDSSTWGQASRVREMAGEMGTSFARRLGMEAGAIIFHRPAITPMDVALPYRVVSAWGADALMGRTVPGALVSSIDRATAALSEGRFAATGRFVPTERTRRSLRAELRLLGLTAYGTWTFKTERTDGLVILGRQTLEADDDELVSFAVLQVATVLDLVAARRQAESMARIDTLIGLWNRRGLEDQIPTLHAGARRHGERLVVTVLDVDDLKAINDAQGHKAGDHAIRAVAGALRSSVRQSDVVSRWGGDEFVVVSSQQHPVADRVARRLMEAIARSGSGVRVSAGSAVWGEDGTTWEAVFGEADSRCYSEKGRHHMAQSLLS